MALIKSVRGVTPKIGKNCYLAENATIIGDVEIGDDCSIWFNTVLRGDVNPIRIGNKVNIQDGSTLHTLYQKSVVEIEDNVSVGHNVVIHGARIRKNSLVGIGAIVLDYADIGENSIIAAGSVVLQRTEVPSGSIFGGVPARFIKQVDQKQTEEMIKGIADNYLFYADWYR
ncbi:MAG TPA: gamma carbonic anhydrase family protein [Bacteroidales bacterium]|nr:gamma carbonic anhydrase family protein [Bacteroidales bacterium]